jgi:putative ATP-binding cassette transporter
MQQRLSFARVLLHRPAWVLMEEATSAFDASTERELLEMLRRELPDSTFVAFGARPAIDQIFDRRIALTRSERAEPLDDASRAASASVKSPR